MIAMHVNNTVERLKSHRINERMAIGHSASAL